MSPHNKKNSQHRKTVAELRHSELVDLLGLNADWVWQTDEAGEARSVLAVSGDRPSRRLVERFASLLNSNAELSEALSRKLAFSSLRVPALDGDGEVEISGKPVMGEDGEFLGFRGVTRLISRKVCASQLATSTAPEDTVRPFSSIAGNFQEALEHVLSIMPAQVILYDKNDRFLFANAEVRRVNPDMAPVHEVGVPLRAALEAAVQKGMFYRTDDEELDALLRADPQAWIDEILRLWAQPGLHVSLRCQQNGRWIRSLTCRHTDGTLVIIRIDMTEQREAELESDDARQKLEAIVEALPAALVVYDKDNRLVTTNEKLHQAMPAMREHHSKPNVCLRDSLIEGRKAGYFRDSGLPEIDALYDKDENAWLDAMERLFDEPERVCERQSPDGRWYKSFNHRLENGLFVGVSVDITDQKEAEIRSEAMSRRLANVIDSLHLDVLIYDENNNLLMVNKQMRQKIAKGLHEPGQTLRDSLRIGYRKGLYRYVLDPEVNALYDQGEDAWIDAMEQYYDQPYRTYERRRRDGSWYRAIDVRTNDGLLVMIRVDLTKEKKIQDDLKQSLSEIELFREIVDNVPVAIYTKDQTGRLTYANKSWGRMSRCNRHEAIGKTDIELFGDSGRQFAKNDAFVMAEFEAGRAIEGGIEIDETRWMADGTVQYQHSSKSRLELNGKPVLLGSTIDVTEARQREAELATARQQAETADRAKSEFLANMSHEIRTPMNGVLGMAELLVNTELTGKQRTFTDVILKSGNALLTIINDILDFSKIDAGHIVLEPAPFDLEETVQDIATLMSVRAKKKDLELIVRYAPNLPSHVVGDAGRVRQVVTNLVGNAVKFTEEGHVLVDVSGSTTPGGVELAIRVADTGIGIPAENIQSVFDKFSQVDTSSTRRHEGTGLGLAITSRLVELMNGTIEVESVHGKGSSFTLNVTLPIAESQQPPKVVHHDMSGARVLVIDDNSVNRSILLEQLASWNFDACAAASGNEGLAILAAARDAEMPVDCVVLDYQMPLMNGEEVARAINADPDKRDLAVIMLTSVDYAINQSNCREMGVDAYLVKPARSSTLLDAIVTVLHERKEQGSEDKAPRVFRAPVSETNFGDSPGPGLRTMADGEPMGVSQPDRSGDDEEISAFEEDVTSSGFGELAERDGGLDLLIAEDNEVNQMVVEQILNDLPYSYRIVENGELAVEAFLEQRPRLILMDVSMPRMNGLEATASIRNLEEKHNLDPTPIVAVTAHALKGDRERCLESGMDDYLSKPINHAALHETLERHFNVGGQLRNSA
ncbi:response regulator [Notoacmeibacter ruber]|uniref:Sensory/regulatory protein RpfC n=1 Tax=Notoacmeibacter ruber TaxID=2670375 RepID=A0A3L7JD31_9HYPH|nr:response regulator [Notoacmeibacter ruber]RLQ88657.1 response regulator [Notoacmeibacter ruber]